MKGKWGLAEETVVGSFVSVHRKGSMDSSLWQIYLRKVILKLYPTISKTITRCPVNGFIISGPVFLKCDAGQGRLSKAAESVEFRMEMMELGLVIMLGLPNGTGPNQEMDAGYSSFKPACWRSTVRVIAIKIARQVEARKKVR